MGAEKRNLSPVEALVEAYPHTVEQLREAQEKFNNRHATQITTAEHSDAAKAYFERLNAETAKQPEDGKIKEDVVFDRAMNAIKRPQKQMRQVMEYEVAKRLVWKIGNAILEERGRKWEIEDCQKEIVESLVKYFINDPTGRLDNSKGLYLWGDVGRGKTFLFEVMKVFADAVPITAKRFRMVSCAEIADKLLWARGESGQQMSDYHQGGWMFDDLGNEPGAIKSYGNEVQVMERLLVARYSKFTNGLCLTHVTSNDTPDELLQKYGTRLSDRAKEMFNFVFLRGESKRK